MGIAVILMAGCEVLFPFEPSRDAPAGPLDDGGPPLPADAAIDADPRAPDAPPAFCTKATAAFFCADFDSPPTGLSQMATARSPGGEVDESLGSMRAELPAQTSDTTEYAIAYVGIPYLEFQGTARFSVRASQPIDAGTCQPDVATIVLGQNGEVRIAVQAVWNPGLGYKLTYRESSGASDAETQIFPYAPIAWHVVEVVVDGPGNYASMRVDNSTAATISMAGIGVHASAAHPRFELGVGVAGTHGNCQFRFDEVTLELLP